MMHRSHICAAFLSQAAPSTNFWAVFIAGGVALLATVAGVILLLRRAFRKTREEHQTPIITTTPGTENPSAFMAASMQGVIQKLREQERELERLHKLERERAETSERLSEEVTRNMPAGLLVVNATGIISSANPAAEQTLGMRALAFRRYSEALGEDSEMTRLIGECLASGKIFRREEVAHQPPVGDARHLGVTISPIRKSEGQITGAICLLSDLTQLAALQKQIQLKDNLAALGELSAGIAHEFKNALATISGYAQMIEAEPVTAEAADCASKILEQTQNITHVVTEFLKYARPLEISDEIVDLKVTVERVLSEVSETNTDIRLRSEGQFSCVAGDEGLLRQALLNLALNAVQACAGAPNGGRVLLRGELHNSEGGCVQRILVFDNGPGIAPGVLRKLFRPFFTTKAKGTGLGLAVVQKIVVQHGGAVEAHNRPEGGAAFIITLPLGRTSPEPAETR